MDNRRRRTVSAVRSSSTHRITLDNGDSLLCCRRLSLSSTEDARAGETPCSANGCIPKWGQGNRAWPMEEQSCTALLICLLCKGCLCKVEQVHCHYEAR